MNLWEAARIALRALRVNRLRSALTMLGIVIGVAAVILLVAIGNGVQSSVSARVEPLANLITIVRSSGNVPGGGEPKKLIDADITVLKKQAPDVATVTPTTTGQAVAETQTAKSRTNVIGSTERWLEVNSQDMALGSFFDEGQVRSAARVVVLGSSVATNLFGDGPLTALSRTIRINHQSFRIIGVMQPIGEPLDSASVMPLNTARRYVYGGGDKVDQLIVQATRATAVPAAVDEVIRILDNRHRIQDPTKRDFEVQSLRGQLDTFQKLLRILTLFTASVAAISLVVGSIGVLNIMLVSVTERTREIGVRKAIGATRHAILEQFLIESTVLAGLGGLIGIVVGVGLALLSARLVTSFGSLFTSFAPTISISSVVVSFAVSLAIGLIAGGYPAYRAARLRPIEALRYQ
ncbi:MAG: ABC transporter permease [Pseudonocardiales bacterium]|nr:ABC transporter permease [Pseudonocardiales bacterium]MBV9029229.1 ABC transporter permease [Pseudonocardiales bacterium]MBW0009720.1 ABC transporter permease [Pseudonocardiales bacterium]